MDYYREGEERFGPFSSLLYRFGTLLPDIRRFYGFVVSDIESRDSRLLDVGMGPGDIPIMLARAKKAKRICAVDPSLSMVNLARSRSKGLGIDFRCGSSRYVPFNGRFDMIISTLSFHHWHGKEDSLVYLSKFLKKGGQIRIYEFERERARGWRRYLVSSHSVTEREMRSISRKTGLRINGILKRDGYIRTIFARG